MYYDLYLADDAAALVKTHVAKLLEASRSSSSWRESTYGQLLSFCDAGTLRLVRDCWLRMSTTAADPGAKAAYEKELQRTRDYKKIALKGGVAAPGLRSAAPVALQAAELISEVNERFWRDGTVTQSQADNPNPLFHHALSENMVLHYATDPLLGFHLATAFVELAPGSPLKSRSSGGDTDGPDIVVAAQVQFEEWVAALRVQFEQGLKIRFMVADALAFCHVLQSEAGVGGGSANIYRRQFDVSTCDLDPEEYGAPCNAPRLFDVVDTSNLADHFGLLNYLVATKPLLKDAAASVIYTETLIASRNTGQEQLNALLCGPGPTVSLVLGLSAAEYWTNATASSYAEDIMLTKGGQTRLSWKLNHHLASCPEHTRVIQIDPQSLAKIIFAVYLGMFWHERESLTPSLSPEYMESYPPFHRGSLVTFIKSLQNTVKSDWSQACQGLIEMINNDQRLSDESAVMHEFLVQLHLQGVYTAPWLDEQVTEVPSSCGFHSWESVPKSVVLTLVVPRDHFNKLYTDEVSKFNAPSLQLRITSGNQAGLNNIYLDLHMAFGVVNTQGDSTLDSFSISVQEDGEGWSGSAPLVVSCYVPSAALQVGPRIGLQVQPNGGNLMALKSADIGPEYMVYDTSLDNPQVFITKHLPGTEGHPGIFRPSPHGPNPGSSTEQQWLSASVADDSGRVALIMAHVGITTEEGKQLLEDKVPIQLRQSSPFTIDIVFGRGILVIPAHFVIPVLKEGSNTRIARKSSYIEVIAPMAEPLEAEPLAPFIYPVVLSPESIPVTLNCHHLNLDTLPMLNVEPEHKKANQWLNTLTSLQFSARERLLRNALDNEADALPSLRLNFKESLFTIFMLASGLQGGQTGIFSLNHTSLGVVMLIIVRAVRLDPAAGSAVLDTAVLPLTTDMVTSGELEEFFLVVRELQICAVDVDDAELRLWRAALPALVERCRTWSHDPVRCAYRQPGATVPLTQETGHPFLCTCGAGSVSPDFVGVPGWDAASRYAVRAAIGPLFAAPLVEDVVGAAADTAGPALALACWACGKNSGKLMWCSRCKEVSYCSKECQKADWKKHRMECSAE